MICNARIGWSSSAKALAKACISLIREKLVWLLLSWPKYIFDLFSMSPFSFEIQVWHVQKFPNYFCECCSVVACKCCWWHEVTRLHPVGILLSSGTSFKGCLLVLQCMKLPLSFQLSFQFMKLFSLILPWRTNSLVGKKGALSIQTFLFCLGQGGCIFPSGDLCSFKDEGFPPPTPVSFLTLLHVSLAPGFIPHFRTPMAILGKRICQVYSFFCC